jgi:hypothetical protein
MCSTPFVANVTIGIWEEHGDAKGRWQESRRRPALTTPRRFILPVVHPLRQP